MCPLIVTRLMLQGALEPVRLSMTESEAACGLVRLLPIGVSVGQVSVRQSRRRIGRHRCASGDQSNRSNGGDGE